MTPKRILLVHDDVNSAKLMRIVLEEKNYDVHHITSCIDALPHLQTPNIHIYSHIVLDSTLPDGQFETLARTARDRGYKSRIVITGSSGKANKKRTMGIPNLAYFEIGTHDAFDLPLFLEN